MICSRYVKSDDVTRFTYPGFKRFIGSDGELNAYGTVVCQRFSDKYPDLVLETIPVICLHGGSAWLCASCAKSILDSAAVSAHAPNPTNLQR